MGKWLYIRYTACRHEFSFLELVDCNCPHYDTCSYATVIVAVMVALAVTVIITIL